MNSNIFYKDFLLNNFHWLFGIVTILSENLYLGSLMLSSDENPENASSSIFVIDEVSLSKILFVVIPSFFKNFQ